MVSKKETQKIATTIQERRGELVSNYRVRQTAVGFKIKNGKLTDEIGIIVFVSKKQDKSRLRALQIEPIPKHIDGVVTDVQAIRFFPRMADDARHRPIEGGIATIRYPSRYVGTLGLIISKGSKSYGITNNHVGANEDVLGMKPPSAKKGRSLGAAILRSDSDRSYSQAVRMEPFKTTISRQCKLLRLRNGGNSKTWFGWCKI